MNNNNLPSTSTAANANLELDLATLTKEKLNFALQVKKRIFYFRDVLFILY
jgi:hypothetical protein